MKAELFIIAIFFHSSLSFATFLVLIFLLIPSSLFAVPPGRVVVAVANADGGALKMLC
jgi:hypothetical protein